MRISKTSQIKKLITPWLDRRTNYLLAMKNIFRREYRKRPTE